MGGKRHTLIGPRGCRGDPSELDEVVERKEFLLFLGLGGFLHNGWNARWTTCMADGMGVVRGRTRAWDDPKDACVQSIQREVHVGPLETVGNACLHDRVPSRLGEETPKVGSLDLDPSWRRGRRRSKSMEFVRERKGGGGQTRRPRQMHVRTQLWIECPIHRVTLAWRWIERPKGPRFECVWRTLCTIAPSSALLLRTPQDLREPTSFNASRGPCNSSADLFDRRAKERNANETSGSDEARHPRSFFSNEEGQEPQEKHPCFGGGMVQGR